MRLTHITIQGFKSFAKKVSLDVTHDITGVVGPNGSGKSNVAEAIRFALGEQSVKSMRGKLGTDLIFKGSQHISPSSKASVILTIDNRHKTDTTHASEDLAPFLMYDELVLSRTLYGDGTSDYTLNDAKVRLKDVQELLAFAGLGSSAHTMISQGEADKILLADVEGRKAAIEDALGLRVYHMRLRESERKLERTKGHLHEVDLLRKEILPHLGHLKRQVEKIESKEKERQNLHELLTAYLKREEDDLNRVTRELEEKGKASELFLKRDAATLELSTKKELLRKVEQEEEQTSFVINNKNEIYATMRELQQRRDDITKTIGRLTGEITYITNELAKEPGVGNVYLSKQVLTKTGKDITFSLENILDALSLGKMHDAEVYTKKTQEITHTFFGNYQEEDYSKEREKLSSTKEEKEQALRTQEEEEKIVNLDIIALQAKIDSFDEGMRAVITAKYEEEKKLIVLESEIRELDSKISLRLQEERDCTLRKERFESLLSEGALIVGRHLLSYREAPLSDTLRDIRMEDLLRAIDKSKFKIEEAGVPNQGDVLEEYRSVKEREEYLKKELDDIKQTEEKLVSLITDLQHSLSEKFEKGVKEISQLFSTYFSEIFPGGKAFLSIVPIIRTDEFGNEMRESGVDIDVSLPAKKVKEIGMFSGGERALISIALLFAMSSLIPPPFMVLDETDAPLDESNARKYGTMLARLASKSKLLVITHNRETMNHCDMLYGVTLGSDGTSKLLSISLKD